MSRGAVRWQAACETFLIPRVLTCQTLAVKTRYERRSGVLGAVKSTVSSRSVRAHHTTPSQRTVPHPSASKILIPPPRTVSDYGSKMTTGSRSGIYTTSEKLQPPLQWIYTYQYIRWYIRLLFFIRRATRAVPAPLRGRKPVDEIENAVTSELHRSRFNSSSRLRRGHVVLRMSLSYTITCSHTAALAGAGAWLTSPSSWHRQ